MTILKIPPQHKINGLTLVGFVRLAKRNGTGASERHVHLVDEQTGKDTFISETAIERNIALAESNISEQHHSSAISFKELLKQWENTKASPYFSNLDLETLIELRAGLKDEVSIYNNGNKVDPDLDPTLI